MTKNFVFVLLLVHYSAATKPTKKEAFKVKCPQNVTTEDPIKFLISWNREAAKQRNKASLASWNFMTNMTDYNHEVEMTAKREYRKWRNEAQLCAKVAFKNQLDKCKSSKLKNGLGES